MTGRTAIGVESVKVRPRMLRLRPVYRDIVLTALTSVLVSASGVLVVSLIARRFGPQSTAEYLLLRRVAYWIYTGALLGMGVAIPRFVAYAVDDPDRRQRYFWAAVLSTGGLTLLLGILLNAAPRYSAKWLFGSQHTEFLVWPLSILFVSQIGHALVFAYCRGLLWMRRANLLQFVNMAAIPLLAAVLLWRTSSISTIVSLGAAASILITLVVAISLHVGGMHVASPLTVHAAGDLLRYGVARVPCDFGTAALFTLGPVIAGHYVPMREVGFLLLGLGLLTVIGTSTNPMNQVLLSKVSTMLARGQWQAARARVEDLMVAALEIALFVSFQALVFADVIIRSWVGPQYLGRMLLIRLCLLAVPSYLFYTALRSVIDAAAVEAHNARNVLVAVAIFGALVGASTRVASPQWLLEAIAASLLVALVFLSALTAHTVTRLYRSKFFWGELVRSCLWAAFLGGTGYVLRRVMGGSLFTMAAIEFVVGAAFLAGLWKLDSRWLKTIVNDLLPPRTVVTPSTASGRPNVA